MNIASCGGCQIGRDIVRGVISGFRDAAGLFSHILIAIPCAIFEFVTRRKR